MPKHLIEMEKRYIVDKFAISLVTLLQILNIIPLELFKKLISQDIPMVVFNGMMPFIILMKMERLHKSLIIVQTNSATTNFVLIRVYILTPLANPLSLLPILKIFQKNRKQLLVAKYMQANYFWLMLQEKNEMLSPVS